MTKDPKRQVTVWLGVVWVWFFLGLFVCQPLPNNGGVPRYELLPVLPFSLLDAIDPPQDDNSPPRGLAFLGERLPLWGIAAAIALAGWGCGQLVMITRLGQYLSRGERHYFSILIGLGLLSLLVLGCGLAGWLSTGLFWSLHLLAIAGGGILWWRGRKSADAESENSPEPATRWWLVAVVPFLIGMLLGSLSPSTDFDVNEYHLGGPKEWYLAGNIHFLGHDIYTSFPFLTEMLLLDGMVLLGDWYWGGIAGQAALMLFAPLTAGGIWLLGKRWFSEQAGTFGAVMYLSTPWVFRMSIIAYAEGGLVAYTLGATAAALLAIDHLRRGTQEISQGEVQFRDLVSPSAHWPIFLCGLCAGGAMSCKYTGLVMAVGPWAGVLSCVSSVQAFKRLNGRVPVDAGLGWRTRPAAGVLLIFVAGVSLMVGPWLLKNYAQTGNPVYPLGYRVFGGRDLDDELAEKWRKGHARPQAGSLGGEIVDLGRKAFDVAAVNDWQSPLLLAFALLSLMWPGERRRVWALWGITIWLFLAWWLFTHHLDRFWLPLLPTLAALAGVGLAGLSQTAARRLLFPAFVIGILFNLGFVSTGLVGYNAGLTSLKSASELVVGITGPEIAWMNTSDIIGKDDRVLCVGEAALFHARFPYAYNTVFDRSLFEEWLSRPDLAVPAKKTWLPEDELKRVLTEHGITHIYVNWGEIVRYRQPYSYGYTDFVHPRRFEELIEMGVISPPLALPGGMGVRRIDPDSSDARLVREWAPELLTDCGEQVCLTTGQLFRVRD